MKIIKVSCLLCGWSSTDEFTIEAANAYGECGGYCRVGNPRPTLLRWDYESGEICVSHTGSGDLVRLEIE